MEVSWNGGSPVHPFFFGIHETIQRFFGTPMTSQWTPGHPQITVTISPSPSFSLRLYGELESSHPGRLTLWLGCRRWRQVVQWERIPVERILWGDLTIPDSHNTICFFIDICFIFFKITSWWLPREKWWYTIESQRSICHMPYPSISQSQTVHRAAKVVCRMTRTTAGCLPIYLHWS